MARKRACIFMQISMQIFEAARKVPFLVRETFHLIFSTFFSVFLEIAFHDSEFEPREAELASRLYGCQLTFTTGLLSAGAIPSPCGSSRHSVATSLSPHQELITENVSEKDESIGRFCNV